MNEKYYWIKLRKDFFKRHDIRIIEGMPNGKSIVLFYIKLILESVDHEGELRFSEDIPYTPEMLASVTGTDIETVNDAIGTLSSLELLVIDDNKTIKLPKVSDMVGYETKWAEKKRQYRDKKGQNEDIERTMSDKRKSKRKSKSKSKRQSKIFFLDEKNADFTPPTIEELYEYCESRHNGINPQNFYDYYSAKGWCIGGGGQMKDWRAAVRAWENNQNKFKGDEI